MPSDAARVHARHLDAMRRGLRGTAVGLALFVVVGTVTAVWAAGVTTALWVPRCSLRTSGTGGLASFLGIACPTCNKILMLIFGGPALLAWFDPVRPWLAAAGVIVMGFAAFRTWRTFRESRSGREAVGRTEAPVTGGPQ